MDPEQIILDEDFDDGSTDGGYGEYDYLQQDKDALPVTPLDAILDPSTTPNSCRQASPIEELPLELSPLQQVTPRQPTVRPVTILPLVVGHHPQHRFGVGSGKPSAAALRRGPGRPKKDFLPSVLLKMASTNPSSSPSAAAGGPAGPTLKFSGGVLTGSGQTVVSDAKLMKSIPKRKSDSLGESLALVLPSPDESLGGGGGGGPSTASSSVATTPTTAEMMETDPALLMPAPEESPYFPEKYPGKVCALCALGERSQLGQGEMLRIEVKDSVEVTVAAALSSQEDGKGSSGSSPSSGDKSPKAGAITLGIPPLLSSNKRQKGLNKCKNPVITAEYVDELEKIGHTEPVEFASIKDGGYFYIHRSCASWSFGVGRDAATGTLSNLEVVVAQALSKKCYFCSRYGASLVCKMSCPKSFHYPCIAAAGGFQVIQSYNCFCKEHLGQVPLVCTDDINCRQCSALGDVGNLMMCSICGDHYHGTCVGLAQLPGVRSGWQCGSCKKCQICRVPDSSEGRTVGCEQCDKIYHASCLRPIMTSIPKYGWKCRCCRICSDCGSRTPGAGASSRWHAHFSVCDSCYQQRNKGFSCPICHRAYRAAAHREMVKCSGCNKFVHSTCDAEADLSVYHAKKETNPDYEYLCSPCKTAIHSGRMAAMRRNSSVDDDSMSASQESLNDESMDVDVEPRERIMSGDIGLGKGKPYVASKIAKKRLGLSLSGTNRPKGTGKGFQKKSRLADFSRKRGPKAKMRGIFGVPGLGLQRPTADSSSSKASEEEPGGDNRLVLCSAKDKFVLTQDICVMCGAIGTDQEGCLIACTQCGQCYHPYCTNVKVTKVILQKGWRCLDCTICEGCGQRNDEGRLILCDDCDISYHTYCMDPPLEQVPQGNWKCKWCAICLKCGTNDPGYNCAWLNNYSECGPCASQVSCPCCGEGYADGELIIQCNQCERWLHCGCDQIKSENEAERCAEDGYNCLLCRPHDQPPPHLVPKKKLTQTSISTPKSTPKLEEKIIPLALEGNHYVDGVCLSEHGLHQIKSLQAEFGKRGKRKPKLQLQPPPPLDKDDGILAAIESVVAGSSLDNSFDDVKLEPLDPREEAEIYKDGMVWNDPVPPEGFALVTNEQGVVVLRKKRQRNLQKLGIGGFFVRNRAVRTKDGKEEDEIADGVVPQISEESATSEVKPKKKPIRRKQKNKLIEIYPTILQDAFFGRPLLNSSAPTKFETQESDDDAKSDVSDDKTIKLTADELKYVEEMRIKQEEKQAQEQKALQQSMEQEQAVAAKSAQPATASTQQTADEAIKAEEDDNSDTEALKDVLGLPNDLIEEDFVNRIMNDDEELTKTSAAFDELTADGELGDGLVKATKNELDILSPDFNLDNLGNMDSKEVEEIFKNVMTDESQESQESMFANSMTPYTSNTSTPSHSIDVTKKALPQRYLNTMAMQQHSPQVQQPQQQPPTPTSGPPSMMGDPSMQPQVNLGMQSPQTPQQQQMMNPMGMPSPHIHQSPQHQPMGGPGPTMMIQSPLQQQPTTPGTPIHTMQTTPTTPQPQHMQMMPTPPQQQQQQMQPNMSMLQQQQQQMVMNQQQQQLNRGNQFQQLADPMQQQQSLPPHQQPQQQQQIVTQQIIPGVLPHQQLQQQQQQQQPQLQPGTMPGQIPQSPVQGQWVSGPAGGGPMGPMGQSPQQQQIPLGGGPVMGMVPASAGQVVVGTSGGTAVGGGAGPGDISGPIDDSMGPMAGASAAQKMSERMRLDEPLNELATISSVLYCNTQHPELKLEFPNWADRCKQIFKRWRLLSTEQKQPYLQQARDNRSAIRMKKSQQDQDKINAQQKSMREAEQERQWKQLQQQRAREQQTQQHLMMPDQRMQDPSNPSLQLQVSTDGSPMGPTASPSPTRTQFVSPVSKNRMVPLGGQNPPSSPVPNFQHPAAMGGGGRPGMQIPLQQQQQQQQQQQRPLPGQQQRPNQSPFSPQSQPPQSPHEMLPGSPASQSGLDPFARPPSEGMSDQNYIHHSPQTPRSVGHQSPIQTSNRSPAYSGQPMPNPQTAMRINLDAGYAQAPGTPRPQFSNQVRPTVYARPGDLFGPVQTSPFTSPRSDGFNQPQPQEGNRQLRDLLQRQQVPASGPGVVMGQQQQQQPTQQSPQPMQPQSPYGDDQQQQNMGQLGGPPMQTQQTLQQPNQQMMQMTAPTADNGTFRQPLPPNMMNRPRLQMPGGVGGIRAQGGPGVIPGGPRLQIVRTGGQMVITQQNILQQQQLMRQRMQLPVGVNRPDGPFMSPQGPQQMMQQQPQLGQQSVSQTDQQNIALLAQRLAGEGEAHIPASTAPAPITSGPIAQPQPQQAAAVQAQPGQQPAPDGSSEIPDSVSAELEKLEQEDNAGIGEVEGVGDIFGGLADDDDELLDSLTAEMGADFNILEYADPELDTTDGEKSNLLDSLELDEPEGEKAEDKAKAGPSGEVKTKMMDTGEKVEEQKPVPMGAPQEMVQPAPQLAGPMMQGQMPLMQQQQQQMQMQPMQQQQQVPQGLNPQQASQLQQLIGVGPGQQMQQQQMQGPPQQLQQQLLAGQMKTVRPNMLTAAHLQQIQQQMQQQVQQAAAMGKPMAVGTQLLSKEGAVGVVTANNNVSVTVRTGLVNPSRIQQLKMGGHPGAMVQQNMMPGQQQQQQQRIVQQIQGNRIIQTVANPNQPVGPVPGQQQQQQQLVGVGGQSVLHQQLQQPPVVTQPGAVPVPGQQQPPPPPYPEPPPPYPGSQPGALGPPQQQQQPNQDFENLLANQQQQQQQQQGMRVIQQNLLPGQVPGQPGQMQMQPQQLPPMQQQQPQQPGQLQSPMGGQYIMQQQRINPQWRPQTPIPPGGAVANLINPLNKAAAGPSQQIAPPPAEVTARPIAVYQANLQPAPPVPPENITNEQERQIQLNYENWMNQQKISLENQLKHYETEIGKLRKVKKQLNTKQRQLKKAGNELSEPDMKELTQITADHAVVQKQLDNARKQQRQHTVLIGEYKTKQQAKMQAAGGSPAAQIAPPSPLMSPSPSSQQNMIHQPMAQSPLNNPMLQQPSQSPLHSPGPLMSQSPGPASVNSVMQSPGGNHTNSNSAMSPYNTMQQSPRIGTPHSQAADENPFSPGPSPSPSLPGRLTSPAPRMTSPQHRMSGQPMPPGRMVTSPGGQYVQQNIIVQQNQMMGQQQQAQLQQQNRFVRPQIIPNDPNVRMRVANSLQQQQMMQQNANIRQMQPGGYNSPIGSPQPMVSPGTPQQQQQQQQNIQLMQQQQRMIMIQNQQQQMNQMQQQQQQQMNQMQQQQQQNQQQLAQMQQPNQQQMNFAKQSPVHQPPSPLLSQGGPSTPSPSPMPPSPMYYYQQSQQQQQQQQQQMQNQQQQMIRRPPSAGSQGPVPNQYVQQQQQQQQQQYQQDNSFNGGQNNQQPSGGGGGGGGINNPSNPIPIMPGFGKYGYIKLGLRGGSPMWGNARITKGPPQQQQSQQQPQAGPSQQQSEAAKKAAMMRSRITIVQKAAPSQATPIEEVIAVDSSPDEKQQRMLDYDDEVDKRLVTTEVSLSSVAQGAEGDDIMESFAHTGYEMRASPLGAQIVSSDYELFAQDVVVDCVDNGKEGEKEVAKKTTKDGEKGTNERNIATTEDFEAMIDSRPKDADGKPEEDFIGDEQAKTGMKTPTKDTTVISVGLQQSPKPITYPGRIAIQQTLLQNRPPIVSAVHKKLVKDATETTAKLSIGNTTISVPILKSFPMSATPPKEGGQSQQKQQMSNQAKKVMNSTAISLSSITKNPSGTVISVAGQKINTTSIVTLSSLNLNQSTLITKTFARTSVNNPHPSSSTASQIKIQPVQNITPGQSSQMEIIKSAKPKAPSPSLGYAKLSSLTVTQDTSLPTKIFEDDSVSPDSSIGQEDADQLDKVDSAALDDATRGIDGTTEGETPTVIATAHEGSNDSHSSELKKQGVIPVHVISKSRENSKSPILGPAGQRVISSVPQLSPLSQPNELTMNAMNVSQQVRSIMSSVNPATSGTNIIQVGTSKQELTPTSSVSTISTISFDTVIPGKGDNMSKPETIASILKTVSGKTILPAAAVANASNKPEVGQQQGTMAGGPTKLLNQQLQIGRISPAVSSAGNNILVVKQVRAPLQKQLSQSQVQKQQLVVLAAQQQQQQQQQLQQQQQQQQQHIVQQGGVIIQGQTRIQPAEIPKSSVDSSSTSSIASILSSTLQQPQTRIVNFSEVSTITSQPPPGLIMTSRPGVISSATSSTTTTSILSATLSQPMKSSSTTSASMSTLLQNQLQGPAASFRRSKSTDEAPAGFPRETPAQVISKRLSLEASNPVKMEPVDNNDDSNVSSTVSSTTGGQGCKFSTISSNVKTESDSQNVLLKQLLQNTGTGGTTSSPTPPPMARPPTNQRAPSLGVVSSLEAQLARPVIPPSANPPAMQIISTQSAPTVVTTAPPVTTEPQQPPQKAPTPKLISRETSFVSKPAVSISASHPTPNLAANMLAASIKKEAAIASAAAAAAGTTVQPITVQSTLKTESGPMTVTQITTHPVQQLPPQQQQQQQQPQQQQFQPFSEQPNVAFVKREMAPMPLMQIHQQQQQQSVGPKPLEFHQYQQHQQLPKPGTPVEIKKELPEEQHQQMPMASMPMEQIKQEPPTTLSAVPKEEPATIQPNPEAAAKTAAEIAHELKKKKRREYQKNRRQQQILSNKEQHQTNKKKPRKSTRQEEDYDTYIDSLMLQLRQLPPMQILEPLLPRNFGVCPLFGTGDLTKFTNAKDYSISSGDLTGVFGHAQIPNIADFYNTKPFGLKEPPPEPPAPASTQRGFYDQEFPPIKFETDDRYRYDFVKDRDLDSPDTIISTSSPECGIRWESPLLFPGLRVIKEEDSEDEQTMVYKRMSPIIPIVAPIPIRLKKGISLSADRGLSCLIPGSNKENEGAIKESLGVKSRFGPPTPLKDSSNVTVTVTLSSTAAEDIMGVLRDLANILEIPPPMAYEIVERTTTPPSQKLGLYRTKGRDGKEGAPIDIQTILNGAAKFCRHCDVVILNTLITAKPSEFPLLSSDASQELESEELYFCSKACYRQFQWRPTNILEDKLVGGDKSKLELDLDDNPSLNAADIKQELSEDADISMTSFKSSDSRDSSLNDRKKKLDSSTEKDPGPPPKQLKGIKFKTFSANCFPVQRYKKPTEKEITETLFRMSITVTPTPRMPDDTRRCIFCHTVGDGVADGPSRLLNYDVDKWVHLNCALWSDGVYETVNGALMNLENTLQLSLSSVCTFCNNLGATIKCFKTRCASVYHLSCAMKDNCVFYKNKSTMCQTHAPKTEKDSELTTLSVQRRVYVDRDESRQVASVMHHSESNNLLRVGSLIFLSVGQLLPHQLQSFHTPNYIYPIGYKIMRFYWSMRRPNKRCRYVCSIADVCGRPEFRVLVQEASEEDIELRDITPKAVWQRILDPMATLRKDCQIVQLFPRYISGEDLFGLTEPAVVRILESLPGIETLTDYRFKYGRNPLLELPLAINPSGAARTEPKLKHTLSWKKPHTQRTGSVSQRPTFVPTSSPAGEVACPYSKQFVHSKSSQYKKMKLEWRNNVFLARSKIQGLGLYAARDLEKHTMVIEYIGEVIRVEVSELREKQYEARNRGIYMFRLDEDRVVDATLSGGLARYINHSCNPNCVTEIVEVEREVRIIIFAKRRINRGEELSYDYKFDIEDDAHKISCMCGAPNCKKWMN